MTVRSFVPEWPGESLALVVGMLLGVVLFVVARRVCSTQSIPGFSASFDYHVKLVEWERDRIMSAAKGLGSTSVAFFTAVVTAMAKDDVWEAVSLTSLLGCLLGSLGVLVLAVDLSRSARKFTRWPA